MNLDYNTMLNTLQVMLIVVCIATTAFPLWYGLFNKFWATRAGIAMMLLSVGIAAAWDLTAFLHFWPTEFSIDAYFWIQFSIMAYTIGAAGYVLYALWYNRRRGIMVTTGEVVHDRRS